MSSFNNFLNGPSETVAKRLLGCHIVRSIDERDIVVKIVETEAYSETDPASHSFRGQTPRNKVMFGPPGYLYVYFTYGMHHCMNIVVGEVDQAAAVLIRAVEPIEGVDLIKANRRNIKDEVMLTNGPGKVCQALAIGRDFSGHDLRRKPIKLVIKPAIKASDVASSTRIGISRATDRKWRFYIKDNAYVSRYKLTSL